MKKTYSCWLAISCVIYGGAAVCDGGASVSNRYSVINMLQLSSLDNISQQSADKAADRSSANQSGSTKDNNETQSNPVSDSTSAAQRRHEAEQQQQSPYTYRATEQISEDLSVAFPVDI